MDRIAILVALLGCTSATAQDDLLDLLGEGATGPVYTNASFKTTRVINDHSLENTAHGVLDMRISHRFGFLSGGVNEFFGLDNADVRLGLDYGVQTTSWWVLAAAVSKRPWTDSPSTSSYASAMTGV